MTTEQKEEESLRGSMNKASIGFFKPNATDPHPMQKGSVRSEPTDMAKMREKA